MTDNESSALRAEGQQLDDEIYLIEFALNALRDETSIGACRIKLRNRLAELRAERENILSELEELDG